MCCFSSTWKFSCGEKLIFCFHILFFFVIFLTKFLFFELQDLKSKVSSRDDSHLIETISEKIETLNEIDNGFNNLGNLVESFESLSKILVTTMRQQDSFIDQAKVCWFIYHFIMLYFYLVQARIQSAIVVELGRTYAPSIFYCHFLKQFTMYEHFRSETLIFYFYFFFLDSERPCQRPRKH